MSPLTDGHVEKIAEQAMMIDDFRSSCRSLKAELTSWKNNVTSKDKKLTESMTQLSVCVLIEAAHSWMSAAAFTVVLNSLTFLSLVLLHLPLDVAWFCRLMSPGFAT